MSELLQKRILFTRLVARLIDRAGQLGYQATLGEVVRGKAQARENAASGAGISNSLHLDGLAVDLNLYLNGQWLSDSSDHKTLGTWWKAQHPDCRWGGDFKKPDGNHYSIAYQGRA